MSGVALTSSRSGGRTQFRWSKNSLLVSFVAVKFKFKLLQKPPALTTYTVTGLTVNVARAAPRKARKRCVWKRI